MGGDHRRHSRAASLSRCSSLLSCFNGGQEESYKPIPPLSGQSKPPSPPPTLQLGSKAPRRSLSFSFSFSTSCASKVKEACEQALEAAKKGSPHISQMFVGGQIFVQVAPPKLGPKPCKDSLSPSMGFLHMATTTASMESSPHDR